MNQDRLRSAFVTSDLDSFIVLIPIAEAAMKALETFAIYVTPFLILGAIAKHLLKRYAVDLTDVHSQAGKTRRARRLFLLGGWRTEK